MKFRVELTYIADDREEILPIACLERDEIAFETLGLTLAEGKMILKAIEIARLEGAVVDGRASAALCLVVSDVGVRYLCRS